MRIKHEIIRINVLKFIQIASGKRESHKSTYIYIACRSEALSFAKHTRVNKQLVVISRRRLAAESRINDDDIWIVPINEPTTSSSNWVSQ